MSEAESSVANSSWRGIARLLLKAALLFIAANVLFALAYPEGFTTPLTVYNGLLPGRERLPYGEDPRSYNLSITDLDAMFASHIINAPKAPDEFRVILIGDSATWGILLRPEETLAGQINAANLTTDDGRRVRAYNLGHPVLSLTKDLLILDYALQYQPDMIVWLVTLQSFDLRRQLDAPLVQANRGRLIGLSDRLTEPFAVSLDDPRLTTPSLLERSIPGQRRQLADWLRLQLYGFTWAATGIDQYYPLDYTPRSNDFADDGLLAWGGFDAPTDLTADDLAFAVLYAGEQLAGDVPLLLINEPIYVADGQNSDARYNAWYPHWAYDAYREVFAAQAAAVGWQYTDLWDLVVPAEFTDSPVHLTPAGTALLAQRLSTVLLDAGS